MENPETCDHAFRRVYPRNITGQLQTSKAEGVMFIICCRCGCSPLRFQTVGEWRDYYRSMAGAFPDWPENLRITDYEWGEDIGPAVTFEEVAE